MTASYPPLSSLLPTANLGASASLNGLTFLSAAGQEVSDIVADLLEPLRYRDLAVEYSEAHDIGDYRFTLVTEQPLRLDLFAGLTLVLFPDATSGGIETAVGARFAYQWPIKAYVRRFKPGGDPMRAAFDLFLELAGITDKELYARLVSVLAPSAGDYGWLVAKLSAWSTDFQDPQVVAGTEIEQILAELARTGADAYAAAFEAVVDDLGNFDLDQIFDRLRDLFTDIVGQIDRDDFEALLIPRFRVTLDALSAGVEFPTNVLKPLDASPKSTLSFTTGPVSYDSRTGFDLPVDDSLAVTLTPSAIGETGLTLSIQGCKLDLSRTYNIPEAIADMRPPDFVGVFFKSLVIGLPEAWFEPFAGGSGTTLGIVGRNVLIGTGGVSGRIGLEALAGTVPLATGPAPANGATLWFVLGKKPTSGNRKGFKLGFSAFDMKFRQNVIQETRIKGSLVVPRLAPAPSTDAEAEIDIELRIDADGDFKFTASVSAGYVLKAGDVFSYRVDSLEIGKDDNKAYLSTSGALSFADNPLLGKLITKPIELKKLLIHSDGSIELEGGTVPLPKSVTINLGPAKIAITAIHFGSHEQEHDHVTRQYRYWGFDGGIDVNPGGIDARGDGIKFYYTVDDELHGSHHRFLRIEGIGIDIVIPLGATKDKAALLLRGYLALKDPIYQGSIAFSLPKAKIEGAAAMEYNTRRPAWIIDVSLELPKAIPFGSTSLGIFGGRGLFGFRYIAEKTVIKPPNFAETLTENDTFGDYYRAAPKGVSVANKKFLSPDKTAGATNPISIGVGVSLATLADGGKAFTSQLFLLVSVPLRILLDGRADIMAKKRIGVIEDPDPPFYAYVTVSDDSLELGAGVDYLTPRSSGELLTIHAALEAAFFFKKHDAWFVHFGTKEKPTTARVLDQFDAYAYLMLSASGIEAGTGVHFDFHREYGPVSASAYAYLDLWAYLSFQGAQSGGGIAAGGMIDISFCGLGLNIALAMTLTVEAPRPYRIAGSVELCVSVRILIKTFSHCFTLKLEWMRDQNMDRSPVFALPAAGAEPPASAVHMLSGATYDVEFSESDTKSRDCYIPLDAYVDVKFSKLLDPSPVGPLIGGYTSPPVGESESVPPRYAQHIVGHSYALESVAIKIRGDDGAWHPYHPYIALTGDAVIPPAEPPAPQTSPDLAAMPLGVWQKQEPGYGQIRFLALTPFSFIVPGVGFRPEQSGVTPKSIYCVTEERAETCLTWTKEWLYFQGIGYEGNGLLYRIEDGFGEALALTDPRLAPFSLGIVAGAKAIFRFPDPVASCRITLATGAPQIIVRFQRRKLVPASPPSSAPATGPSPSAEYEDVLVVTPTRATLANAPLAYLDPANPIDRIIVEPPVPDYAAIAALEEQIELLRDAWVTADKTGKASIEKRVPELEAQLRAEHAKTCVEAAESQPNPEIAILEAQIDKAQADLAARQSRYDAECGPAASDESLPEGCAAPVARAFRFLSAPSRRGCDQLAKEIAALEQTVRDLEAKLAAARRAPVEPAPSPWPAGWACATFVHEICWLSERDHQFNQSIPGIDAIEADFSTMRDAARRVIQPIWRPGHEYRIELELSDEVTASGYSPDKQSTLFYVHFRTEAPIGLFTQLQPPGLLDHPQTPATYPPVDDGRVEVPERALKFYIDQERSFPDPSGKLLYAKPVYWADVELDLFFAWPHAFHFFADWPDLGLGARHYAMEIRVKDPAEAPPVAGGVTPPYQDAVVPGPKIGVQQWVEDLAPRQTEELNVLSAFQTPLANGGQSSTACLAIGGGTIVPAARKLHSALGDLQPDKLYTAVVFNTRLDAPHQAEAEVHRYPFRTSRHEDFASHIGSCMLADTHGNQRMAVFDVGHDLADASGAAQAYAAALAVVSRQGAAGKAAYPDHFDLLIHDVLKLTPLAPPLGLEFNFMTNTGIVTSDGPAPETYGLWIRSDEPLNDARIPNDDRQRAIRLFEADNLRGDIVVLVSKDGCEAFLMRDDGGPFPTADVAIEFYWLRWNQSPPAYVPRAPGGVVRTARFARPVGGPP
jgi:hypothetical protein